MNILMQILDEGKIDDAQGRTVSFENTVICMTSNAGSTDKSIGVGFNRKEEDITKERAMKALQEFLRPEFMGRIDEIIVFNKLSKENYAEIAKLMLEEMREPLAEKQITLAYTEEACQLIAEKAYGKAYGAREIRRVIRQEVEDQIAEKMISHVDDLHTLTIVAEQDNLVVEGNQKS
jgi:ATP-dependent Clp protease ATP-binding subunit ClpA